MPIAPGTKVGSYEITRLIGAGGMGEVYRARDTKLDRDVAIKVLPDAFAADDERLARFEREAKLLASLNHPNIASIYGLEESDGVKALVLELIERPTLAERIEEGSIAIEETIAIARRWNRSRLVPRGSLASREFFSARSLRARSHGACCAPTHGR